MSWLSAIFSDLLTVFVTAALAVLAGLPLTPRERRKKDAGVKGSDRTGTPDTGVLADQIAGDESVIVGSEMRADGDITITEIRPRRKLARPSRPVAGRHTIASGRDVAVKDLRHYHEKGRKDRAHGKSYNSPQSGWPYQIVTRPHEQAQRDAYNAGWENAQKEDGRPDRPHRRRRPHRSHNERTISIWIAERSEDSSKPLQLNGTYTLNFKIGAPVPGSLVSGPETEVPSADVPSGGLHTEWLITSSTVELASGTQDTVIERVQGSTIWTARFSLFIPEEGESAVPQLRITPRSLGKARLDVVILARNEVYRQLAVELAVEEVSASSPDRVVSLRDEVVHASAGQLNLRAAQEWMTPPGTLTIAVMGGTNAWAQGDAGRKPIAQMTQWEGAQGRVAPMIDNARSAAERFRARWEDYLNDIDADDLPRWLDRWQPESDWGKLGNYADADHRRRWDEVRISQELHNLASDGRRLYEAFFPRSSDLRRWTDSLAFGQRLNIFWLPTGNPGWVPDVPWGLMYLLDAPAPGEPVDPMGFLAFRLRLGYVAHPVQAPSKALGGLDQTYGSHYLYWGDDPQDLTGVEARWHKQLWATSKNQVFVPAAPGPNAKSELVKLLNEPEPPPVSVLYLFCQWIGGDGPGLRFGGTAQPSDVLRRTDLGTKLLADHPLVFANACATAGGDPYHANQLEQIFFDRGCRAYLGTQTKVPIPFANRFASVFFHFFYRRADGAPVAAGEAVAQARLFLWTRYRNIGGLFYTYVNLYELFMASDAEVVALRA